MLLLKPEVGDLRLAAAEIVCELLLLDFSTRCRVSPPYHSHAWYTPWSVFQDGPVGDVVIVWQSLLLELFSFPSAPGAVLADGTGLRLAPPLLPREFRCLIRHLPEPALPSACRKSASRLLPDPQLRVMIRGPRGRPVEPARHILQQQVTTLQPLPTQRFQVF